MGSLSLVLPLMFFWGGGGEVLGEAEFNDKLAFCLFLFLKSFLNFCGRHQSLALPTLTSNLLLPGLCLSYRLKNKNPPFTDLSCSQGRPFDTIPDKGRVNPPSFPPFLIWMDKMAAAVAAVSWPWARGKRPTEMLALTLLNHWINASRLSLMLGKINLSLFKVLQLRILSLTAQSILYWQHSFFFPDKNKWASYI